MKQNRETQTDLKPALESVQVHLKQREQIGNTVFHINDLTGVNNEVTAASKEGELISTVYLLCMYSTLTCMWVLKQAYTCTFSSSPSCVSLCYSFSPRNKATHTNTHTNRFAFSQVYSLLQTGCSGILIFVPQFFPACSLPFFSLSHKDTHRHGHTLELFWHRHFGFTALEKAVR